MIRANIGNAVIDIAAPRNSIASNSVAFSENNPGILTKPIANNAPRMNGAAIPAKETAAALRTLLLSGKTYDWKASNGGRQPQFYLRLRFHRGEELVDLDFCFMCHVVHITRAGEEIGHANFSPNSDLILQALRRVFPDDEPLKQVAKEAGLPL